MLIFNDTYSWKGPGTSDDSALWLLSCRLWIIDLRVSSPDLTYFKPVIVVAMDISDGPKRKICAESLARRIYKDFNLDIRRTLWVEYDPGIPEKLFVATMEPRYHDGIEMVYSIHWRKLFDSELKIIRDYIPDIEI